MYHARKCVGILTLGRIQWVLLSLIASTVKFGLSLIFILWVSVLFSLFLRGGGRRHWYFYSQKFGKSFWLCKMCDSIFNRIYKQLPIHNKFCASRKVWQCRTLVELRAFSVSTGIAMCASFSQQIHVCRWAKSVEPPSSFDVGLKVVPLQNASQT